MAGVFFIFFILNCQIQVVIFPGNSREASPDGAVVAASHCQRLCRVDSQGPQFPLAVTLHDEEGFVAVVDDHLEDLAVLRAHQDVVSPPADAAYGQPFNNTR